MKWFWYSLFLFLLLMCSCKSKKVASNVASNVASQLDLSYLNKTVKIDSSKTAYFANEVQNIVIEEDITVIEYDKESGKPIKETNAKRKTTQDINKVAAKDETKGESVTKNDSIHHVADVSKKIETETQTVTKSNGLEFWKWLGIVLGIGFIGLIIYICKKLRVF